MTTAVSNLGRGRQSDETSSAYERRQHAHRRYQSQAAQTPVVQRQETSTDDVPNAPLTSVGPTNTESVFIAAQPAATPVVVQPVPSRQMSFDSRVVLQRVRDGDLQQYGRAGLPDQNIRFGQDGQPYSVDPDNDQPPQRPARRMRRRQRGGQPPEDGDESSSEDEGRGPPRIPPDPPPPPNRRDSEQGSRERSFKQETEHAPVDRFYDERSQTQAVLDRRTPTIAAHLMPRPAADGHWRDYLDEGRPFQTQYMKDVHAKYHRLIEEQIGAPLASMIANRKPLRLPTPSKYAGQSDIETFDAWLMDVLRWLKLNDCAGPDKEPDRIAVIGIYLSDNASAWYRDSVESVTRRRPTWTFPDIITGLFDRFIYESSIQVATKQFFEAKYTTSSGVLGFYFELERYASRMIHAPDNYTFKRQLLQQLPRSIRTKTIENGGTAERATIREILELARRAEDAEKTNRTYDSQHHTASASARIPSRDKVSTTTKTSTPAKVSIAPQLKTRFSRDRSRPPTNNRPIELRRTETRPSAKAKGKLPERPRAGSSKPRPTDKCHDCGHLGHWAGMPQCPHQQARLAAIAEVDGHDGHQNDDQEAGHEQPQLDQQDEPEEEQADDEAEPYEGSQYSSPGEEYNARFFDEYEGEDDEDDERIFAIRRIDEDSYELPQMPWISTADPNDADDEEEPPRMTKLSSSKATKGETEESRMTTYKLRKSSRPMVRPKKKKSESRPIAIMVFINGLEAITLLDTGSTADAVSPEFARVADMKIFELENPVSIQLGCKGSRSKINFGSEAVLRYGSINQPQYWDVVNLDRYDAIIGIGAMRKYGIAIDPANNRVTVLGKPTPTLSEGEEGMIMEQRSAYRRSKSAGH